MRGNVPMPGRKKVESEGLTPHRSQALLKLDE